MPTADVLPDLVASLAIVALTAYLVLGGADFGGGVWNLLASGPRTDEQRTAVAAAIGPVWEANHVWLIFLVVILFTAFPLAFSVLSVALFWLGHLVLLGIVLRGAAFVFRAHGHEAARSPLNWGNTFGVASLFTPVLLGAALGVIASGRIRVVDGVVQGAAEGLWISPFPLAAGLLVLAVCAYLAAVYLTLETRGDLREDFRKRGLGAWAFGGAAFAATILLAWFEAPNLWSGPAVRLAAGTLAAGAILALGSGLALWQRRFSTARVLAIGQVALLVAGWALAQRPYILYPDLTIQEAAAPAATLSFVLWTLPFGMVLLVPSLALLFAVFKGLNPAVERDRGPRAGT